MEKLDYNLLWARHVAGTGGKITEYLKGDLRLHNLCRYISTLLRQGYYVSIPS
jgi:hypothetical protein